MRGGDYQIATRQTAVYPGQGEFLGVLYTALGLAGEAGEVSNKVKKVLRDDNGEITDDSRAAILDEIGDTLWYCARLADEMGVSLSTVMAGNLEKLAARQKAATLGGSGDAR